MVVPLSQKNKGTEAAPGQSMAVAACLFPALQIAGLHSKLEREHEQKAAEQHSSRHPYSQGEMALVYQEHIPKFVTAVEVLR